MNNFIVKVSKNNRMVLPEHTYLGNDGENLQYNLEFRFIDGFVDGIARLEYQMNDEKYFLTLNKINNAYTLPIKNVITKEGNIPFQLVITESETEDGIPLYKSDIFNLYCKESINAVDEAPDGYELWIDEANQKLMEMEEKIAEVNNAITETDNLNITVNKENTTVYIRLTNKDGTSKTVTVSDGIDGTSLDFNWDGTSLGIKTSDESEYQYVDLKGDTGNGIASITKTGTSGLVDTYTIYYTNGNTTTFTVTNGEDGEVTQAQLDETNREVERAMMVYNALPKITDTDTQITLNGTANCPMELELKPSELTQETTTGANKFSSILEQGTINSGTGQPGGSLNRIRTKDFISVNSSNQYSVSLKNSDLYNVIPFEYDESENFLSTTSNWNNVPYSFTTGSTTKKIKFVFKLKTDADLTPSDVSELILKAGSTAEPYEAYTGGIPSPNPDYPQTVQTITGNNSIKIENINLYDGTTSETNKRISVSNGATYGSTGYSVSDYVKINPNTSYSLTSGVTSYFSWYDENKTYISGTSWSNGTYKTSPNNAKYLRFDFITGSNVILNYGTTASTYVPHQEQVKPLTLGDKEICKIGDYEDKIFKAIAGNEIYDSLTTEEQNTLDYGKWYLRKNIGKVVLNGSENIIDNSGYTSNKFFRAVKCAEGAIAGTYMLSNYFIGGNITQSTTGLLQINNVGDVLLQPSNGITNADDFKTWLSTHNTNVYFRWATPTHTEITDSTLISQLNAIEQAVSYDGQTNISQTNAQLPFRIKASAIMSLANIFDQISGGE